MEPLEKKLLDRGVSISKTVQFGYQGEPINEDEMHCIDCGVMKKDHANADHQFRKFDPIG
jgi:hypothetical protein